MADDALQRVQVVREDHRVSNCPPVLYNSSPLDRLAEGEISSKNAKSQSQDSTHLAPRSLSLGSLLDYGRTKKWLQTVIKYPESYATKLTHMPSAYRPLNTEINDSGTDLLPTIDQIRLAQRVTGFPNETTRSDSHFDGFLFRKAVGDLERLLTEAINLSSMALPLHDRPGSVQEPDHISDQYSRSSFSSDEESIVSEEFSSGDSSLPRKWQMDEEYDSDTSQRRLSGSIDALCWHKRGTRSLGNFSYTDQHVKFKLPDGTMLQHDGNGDMNAERRKKSGRRQTGQHGSSAAGPSGLRELPHDYFVDDSQQRQDRDIASRRSKPDPGISLHKRSHVSLRGQRAFNLARSRKRQPIARDWSTIRKRFVAIVACLSTALIGILVGIYAGLVPSIQYYILDETHIAVLGNMGLFIAMALPTFFLWPLPLLHGRKPYILTSLVMAMPLLFPQALAVNSQRLTNTLSWRGILLASRALMGGCLGFASMNFHCILMDLFGVSLMSVNPHQEVVDQYDARRHGGGMGAWLGIWTWCWVGSLSTGFFVGAVIIDNYTPAWGFYVSIIIIAVVLFLNVVCPETRRSAYRRSVAEVRTGKDVSRRVAKGEIMMHRTKTGPRWWGQEVYHGIVLSLEMLRQPGFLVMSIYSAWIYAEVLLLIILLGSLASKYYDLRPTIVGLLVFMIAIGAFLAVPFQKANLFSRSRLAQLNTSSATLDKRVSWSSHMVRRTVFTILLPIAGICYAAVSSGPPLSIALPTLFATAFGFLSCLAISECNGFIMEAFDCSDLSPGMTGRQRGSTTRHPKKTNYSSFPRVTAGFAVIHTFSFLLAAASTALGGKVTRTLGQQVSTGVVAGILLILTIILLMVLIRFIEVKIVPSCKLDEMDRIIDMRRKSTLRRTSMPNDLQAVIEEEKAWRPAMIGNPIGKTRRMNIFELGSLTRWQEIRKKNKLIDSGAHAHLNRTAWNQGLDALDDQMSDFKRDAQEFLHIGGKGKGTRRLKRSNEDSEDLDFSSYSMSDQGPAKNRKLRTPRDGSMNEIIDGAREARGA